MLHIKYLHLGLCYKIPAVFCCCLFFLTVKSQLTISGTVYDSTKTILVKDVLVRSTSGTSAITDSNGRYSIVAFDNDSLVFTYQGKPTLKFAVSQVPNIGSFEIALHVRVTEKYKTLKEVKVFGKNYQRDSAENRERYAKIFNYQKPGIRLSTNDYSGAAGIDLNELINIFRFKRNKQLKKMRQRLEDEEKEKFIDYRFNKMAVRRVTRLDGADLENFMKAYRPSYEFTTNSDVVNFYQYILNASYEFKINKEKEIYIDTRFNRGIVKTAGNLNETELDVFMKRYRPSYEFASSSSPQEFYQYIINAVNEFKKTGLQKPNNITDSTDNH